MFNKKHNKFILYLAGRIRFRLTFSSVKHNIRLFVISITCFIVTHFKSSSHRFFLPLVFLQISPQPPDSPDCRTAANLHCCVASAACPQTRSQAMQADSAVVMLTTPPAGLATVTALTTITTSSSPALLLPQLREEQQEPVGDQLS